MSDERERIAALLKLSRGMADDLEQGHWSVADAVSTIRALVEALAKADTILSPKGEGAEAVAWRFHDGAVKGPADGSSDLFDFITADGREYRAQKQPNFWHLVSLWRPHVPAHPADCDRMTALAALSPQGLGALRASPSVTTEGHEAAALDKYQLKAIERAAMDSGCTAWRRCRLAMVEGDQIVGYPAFSRADMAELARLYREEPAPSPTAGDE